MKYVSIKFLGMKNIMKRTFSILITGVLFLFAAGAGAEVVDRIVALVNSDIITLSEVDEAAGRLLAEIGQTTPPAGREEKIHAVRREVLNQLIENKLLEQEMQKKKVEVSDREVDLAIGDVLQANHFTENDLKEALAKQGTSFTVYRRRIREDIGKMRLISREIKSKIVIKDEDLHKAYQQKLQEFMEPLEVKVQQIFFQVPNWASSERITVIRQEAEGILRRARNGEEFEKLARQYSQGPEANEGGVLGFFKHNEMRPELEAAAFSLKPGGISDLVRTTEGLHILRVMERKGGAPKSFAEVQNKLRNDLVEMESERQFVDWMKALKAKSFIDIRL